MCVFMCEQIRLQVLPTACGKDEKDLIPLPRWCPTVLPVLHTQAYIPVRVGLVNLI